MVDLRSLDRVYLLDWQPVPDSLKEADSDDRR